MDILIVDDESEVRKVLHDLLSRLGYECKTAASATEALNTLQREHFPIIITDLGMPEIDGMELLKTVKDHHPHTYVVCMTGQSSEYTFVDVVKAGASDFMLKPFSQDEVEAKIRRIEKERKLNSDIITSRNKLMAFFDGIRDVMYMIDNEFKIISANKAFAESVGMPVKDTIGKLCYQLANRKSVPCESEGYVCPAVKSFTSQSPSTTIQKYLKKSGEECYKEVTATPLVEDGNRTTKVIIHNRDISERKKAEKELKTMKEYLDNLIENSPDPIVVADSTGIITMINKAFLELLGYRKDELIGKHTVEYTPMNVGGTYECTTGEFVQIDKEYIDDARTMIAKLFEEGKVSNWCSYFLRKDKKVIPIEQNIVSLCDVQGTITGYIGIDRDITERKKMEMENSKLLEETKNALEELKKTQSYLLQNEKMASIGQLAAGVAHEINNPTGFVHSNLGSLNKYSDKVLELLTRYEEGLASLNKNNGTQELVSFCEEMEELKKKLKIDFIMKDFKKVIADSLEGTERIRKIVADLKSFSRVDQAEFKYANINEGLESTLNVVWNELKYKCTVEKDYGELPQIHCNLGHLNQVFMNILVNAAQAIAEKGTIKITTRYVNGQEATAKEHNAQGSIEVTISDTGCGIPEDKLKRIFEPFFTTKPVGGGTGLGLSIAYDIIKKHQGEITVASERGKGTIFTITLPFVSETKA